MPETPADVAAAPDDSVKTESGLASKVLQAGTGDDKPTAADTVTVHYSGWTTDGKMFDSSVERGEPTSFPLGQVIAGWTEGLQLMNVGGKYLFEIPPELGYGVRGSPPKIGANAAGMNETSPPAVVNEVMMIGSPEWANAYSIAAGFSSPRRRAW